MGHVQSRHDNDEGHAYSRSDPLSLRNILFVEAPVEDAKGDAAQQEEDVDDVVQVHPGAGIGFLQGEERGKEISSWS